jgi:hypothetical protein
MDELITMLMEVVPYISNFPGRPKPVINWALPNKYNANYYFVVFISFHNTEN